MPDKEMKLFSELLFIRASITKSIELQCEILSHLKGKDFTEILNKSNDQIDEIQKELFGNLPDIKE